MDNLPNRLVIYLVGFASIFLILFGIRVSASIINPIFLAVVITITVLPVPSLQQSAAYLAGCRWF